MVFELRSEIVLKESGKEIWNNSCIYSIVKTCPSIPNYKEKDMMTELIFKTNTKYLVHFNGSEIFHFLLRGTVVCRLLFYFLFVTHFLDDILFEEMLRYSLLSFVLYLSVLFLGL